MKEGSDNFRNSSSIELLKKIDKNVEVLIYEPLLDDIDSIVGNRINISLVNDLNSFFEASDIILADRYSKELEVVKEKLFTRDICNVVKQRE
ncbi:UDP-glucose 6-dehydrogenase [Streptococcus pneumoniae]|nr:UDP-glucose 6-dehydrogenase [Streptococcus pneumoniae]